MKSSIGILLLMTLSFSVMAQGQFSNKRETLVECVKVIKPKKIKEKNDALNLVGRRLYMKQNIDHSNEMGGSFNYHAFREGTLEKLKIKINKKDVENFDELVKVLMDNKQAIKDKEPVILCSYTKTLNNKKVQLVKVLNNGSYRQMIQDFEAQLELTSSLNELINEDCSESST